MDDDPLSEETIAALARSKDQIERGEVYTLEEVIEEYGLFDDDDDDDEED